MDVELAVNRLARDLDLVLLLDVGFLDGAAAVGTDVGERRLMDFVDLRWRRWQSMALVAVVVAGLAAGLFGLGLGWPLAKGSSLAFTGAQGLRELRFEFGDALFAVGDALAESFTSGTDLVHT
jgi:hypothetical protein